jgi:hypothetical protein
VGSFSSIEPADLQAYLGEIAPQSDNASRENGALDRPGGKQVDPWLAFQWQSDPAQENDAAIRHVLAGAGGERNAAKASPAIEQEVPLGRCAVVEYQPQRVVYEAELARPGLLVAYEYFDVDWRVRLRRKGDIHWIAAPLWRVNSIFRGVPLNPGAWTVEMQYRPRHVIIGAWVSSSAWLALALASGGPAIWSIALAGWVCNRNRSRRTRRVGRITPNE